MVMLARVGATVLQSSHTVDEPAHIAAGVAAIEAKKHIYDVTHPPLPRMVAAIPLILSGVELPEARIVTIQQPDVAFDAGAKILLQSPIDYRTVLNRGRLAMLIFPVIVLLYVYCFGLWLGSPLMAMLSVVFVSLDPNLIAHSGLITTDLPAVAGFLITGYHGLRWLVTHTMRRAVIAGIAFGVAIGLKLSCIFVLPGLAMLLILRPLPALWSNTKTPFRKVFAHRCPPMVQMVVVVVVTGLSLWATYLFNVDPLISQRIMGDSKAWLAMPMALKSLPIPMPSLILGLWQLLLKGGHGEVSYLFGKINLDGCWYYFPAAFVVKSTIGFLVALIAAIFAAVFAPRGPWRTVLFLLPPSIYLLLSLESHLNYGIRHILPVIPFLYLFTCFQLARGKRALVLIPLIVLGAVESAMVHPHYLSFFNASVGGPAQGSRYLLDSNIDWGQDAGEMYQWIQANAVKKGRPYTLRVFCATPEYVKHAGLDPECTTGPVRGLFAISKNVSGGLDDYRIRRGIIQLPMDYSWLSKYPVVHRIGYSIDIYDLGDDVYELRRQPDVSVRLP
jgi:hypothetical protein